MEEKKTGQPNPDELGPIRSMTKMSISKRAESKLVGRLVGADAEKKAVKDMKRQRNNKVPADDASKTGEKRRGEKRRGDYQSFFDNGIKFGGGLYFRPVDVNGDGNCLFRSLAASGKFPVDDHIMLRAELLRRMREEASVFYLKRESSSGLGGNSEGALKMRDKMLLSLLYLHHLIYISKKWRKMVHGQRIWKSCQPRSFLTLK